ncbi:MAG: hypothetical protein HYW48_08145 [Deltaproteobacteria bacterium]|nr:hypothetical protein [Deltaproteobacteria bacterium]
MNRLFLFVFGISCAGLTYEIVLFRLLAIVQESSVIGVIISLALLGFGYSGSFLSYLKKFHDKADPFSFLAYNSLLFSISSVLSFLLVTTFDYNPNELLWGWRPLLYLFLYFCALSLPFFFVSNCINLAMVFRPEQLHRVYFSDLVGAGLGGLCAFVFLEILAPGKALAAASLLGVLSFVVITPLNLGKLLGAFSGFLVFLFVISPKDWSPSSTSYKPLAKAMFVPETRVLAESSSAYAQISLVESARIPFRYAPGLSLYFEGVVPKQWGLFINGGTFFAVTQGSGGEEDWQYFEHTPESLPYKLREKAKVLQVGLGGGDLVRLARFHNVTSLTVVERNRKLFDFLGSLEPAFMPPFGEEMLHSPPDSPLSLMGSEASYDIIHLSDTLGSPSAFLGSQNDSQEAFTLEMFQTYRERLAPGGLFAISLWNHFPAKESLKAWRMILDTFPRDSSLVIESLQTVLILAGTSPLREEEQRIESFCNRNAFRVLYPLEGASNVYTLLAQENEEAVHEFVEAYPFDLTVPNFDSPHFLNSSKLSFFGDWVRKGMNPRFFPVEADYFHLWASLFMAAICSILFILLPLWPLSHARLKASPGSLLAFAIYFSAIGFSFIVIEIAVIEKLKLLLGQSVLAVSIGISSFLVGGGLGALGAKKLASKEPATVWGLGLFTVLCAYGGVLCFALSALARVAPSFPPGVDLLAIVGLIVPLAFLMGFPFVLGIQRIAEASSHYVSWAWAINGSVSVLSSILAQIGTLHFGFTVTFSAALTVYFIAGCVLPILRKISS